MFRASRILSPALVQALEQPKRPASTKTVTSSFLLKGEPEKHDNENSLITEIIE